MGSLPKSPPSTSCEQAIIGTFIEAPALNGETPFLQKLLGNSPESFQDARCGQIAQAIKKRRETSQPVYESALYESGELKFESAAPFISNCVNSALTLGIAEIEAEKLWEDFVNRQIAKLYAEGSEALLKSPEQRKAILDHVEAEIDHLKAQQDSVAEQCASRAYNASKPPPEPVTAFYIDQTGVSTADNISTISAAVKSGKTALVCAMLASTFASPDADCLGFRSQNPKGLAVLHIDTEQSPYDHHALINQVVERAGRDAKPEWLLSYCLTGFSPSEIREAIRVLMAEAARRFGGILAVLLDGSADAVIDVNNPEESNSFVAELHALAIEYHCSFVCVIHYNPGTDKTRGHLGSQLERKAESNLRLEKDADEIITLFADKNRRAPISKNTGPRFAWDHERGMHVSVQSRRDAKTDTDRKDLRNLFATVFDGHPSLSHTEMKTTVTKLLSVADRTAERKINRADTLGVIKKSCANRYEYKA